jgi:hypothetical protein
VKEDAKLTPKLEKQIHNITRWLKNPDPYTPYEGAAHSGIAVDFCCDISEESKGGNGSKFPPVRLALSKVRANERAHTTRLPHHVRTRLVVWWTIIG